MSTASSTHTDTTNGADHEKSEWQGTNLAGDIVERGIQKNPTAYQDDLRWWYRYSVAKNLSQAESSRMLGIDDGTYSKILRGEYRGSGGLVIAPPAKMLSRIRVLRQQEQDNIKEINRGRVRTPTVDDIWGVCKKAWADRQLALIFGESHIGKTEAAMWFRDEHNHGATLYVDLQGCAGVQDVYRAFARALKISPTTTLQLLMPRVYAAIDRTNLVIVDEFHHITYAVLRGSSNRMVNALKSIKDRCGCGMVILSTNVARAEFTEGEGREAKLLKQLWRRGVIKLQLPDALRVGDVRAFALAYGLPFPAAPESGQDTWARLGSDHPEFEGRALCERIAYEAGVLHLVSVLKDGAKFAAKRKRPLAWSDAIEAQAKYDYLSARKAV